MEYPTYVAARDQVYGRSTPTPEYTNSYNTAQAELESYQNEDEGWAFHMMQE